MLKIQFTAFVTLYCHIRIYLAFGHSHAAEATLLTPLYFILKFHRLRYATFAASGHIYYRHSKPAVEAKVMIESLSFLPSDLRARPI